jgi:hypothetical protein
MDAKVKKEVEAEEPVATQGEVSFQVLTPEDLKKLKIRKRGNGKYEKALATAFLEHKIVKIDCGTRGAAAGLAYKIKKNPEYQNTITASVVQDHWVVVYPV